MFDLHAMQIHGNFDVGDRIFTEEHAMRGADVQALDVENIGGTNQFFSRKNARSRFAHRAAPPAHHRSNARQLRRFCGFQNAEQIQIRLARMKISARRRSVKHQRLQIFSSSFLNSANNFNQFFFSRQHHNLFYEFYEKSSRKFHQLPEAPPPPLEPPPNPPKSPPPPLEPPPPNPPPPQLLPPPPR